MHRAKLLKPSKRIPLKLGKYFTVYLEKGLEILKSSILSMILYYAIGRKNEGMAT